MLDIDFDRLWTAKEKAREDLLAERVADGHWMGELASSALATATAVSALALVQQQGSGFGVQGSGNETLHYTDLPPHPSPRTPHPSPLTRPPDRQTTRSPGTSNEFGILVARGIDYLATQQNEDGGFGDTDLSRSNIATTMLVRAAFHLSGAAANVRNRELLDRARSYIEASGGIGGLRARYGKDKTFAVPILTNCALAGLVDWHEVSPLPFEFAAFPQSWYRFFRLPVVSYAIPALVAIGQARYFHLRPRNPMVRAIRRATVNRTLKVLERMQPDSGGYLEAIPLTSFVVMSLAGTGRGDHAVARRGVRFLLDTVRSDGSWPIDTNLATWVTTLAINALGGSGFGVQDSGFGVQGSGIVEGRGLKDEGQTPNEDDERRTSRDVQNIQHRISSTPYQAPTTEYQVLSTEYRVSNTGSRESGTDVAANGVRTPTVPNDAVIQWLLSCQHSERHAFTGASPGGWGWSDLAGAVPDVDDTAGALLALARFSDPATFERHAPHGPGLKGSSYSAAIRGTCWLTSLQNRDGGFPTFCRGWGALPFDRSSPDLTAHALRALFAWIEFGKWGASGGNRFAKRIDRGFNYLARSQRLDGSWIPLWFGNQEHPDEENPVYGTTRVLMAYRDLGRMDDEAAERGLRWLIANQNADGGWGNAAEGSGFRVQGSGDREQGTGDRGRGTGDREQGSGDGGQGTGDRGRGTGDRGQGTGDRGQGTGDRGQDSDSPKSQVPNAAADGASQKRGSWDLGRGISSAPGQSLGLKPVLNTSAACGSSVEETAWAVEGLLAGLDNRLLAADNSLQIAIRQGVDWLVRAVEDGQHRQPAPVGLYFAKLWYYETLYPLIFTVSALGEAARRLGRTECVVIEQTEVGQTNAGR